MGKGTACIPDQKKLTSAFVAVSSIISFVHAIYYSYSRGYHLCAYVFLGNNKGGQVTKGQSYAHTCENMPLYVIQGIILN